MVFLPIFSVRRLIYVIAKLPDRHKNVSIITYKQSDISKLDQFRLREFQVNYRY